MALVDRVKNILVTPRTEWGVIAAEPATSGALVTGYVIPLGDGSGLSDLKPNKVIPSLVPAPPGRVVLA